MSNPNVSIFSPDKTIKDLQWDALSKASRFARGTLLDVGCGTMPYKSIFLSKVQKYIGIDKNSDVADIKMDFLKTKFSDRSFNTVLCTQVLEHIPDPKKFLKKINRILNKNGVLILTAPFSGYLHEIPYDYYRYTPYGLRYLLNSTNFKIISILPEGNWIVSIGQEMISYLEPTINRFLLKYPKRILQLIILIIMKTLSRFPEWIIKSHYSVINYIVIAEKK